MASSTHCHHLRQHELHTCTTTAAATRPPPLPPAAPPRLQQQQHHQNHHQFQHAIITSRFGRQSVCTPASVVVGSVWRRPGCCGFSVTDLHLLLPKPYATAIQDPHSRLNPKPKPYSINPLNPKDPISPKPEDLNLNSTIFGSRTEDLGMQRHFIRTPGVQG